MNFYGVKLNTTNFNMVDKIVGKIKAAIRSKAQKLYRELLAYEIETLVDEVVLGVHNETQMGPIFDEAVKLLNTKIAVAISKGYDTQYNFSVALNLFSYDKKVYIQAATTQRALFDAILELKDVSDLTVDDMLESDIRAQRVELWESIIKEYKNHSCMIVKAFPLNNPFDKPAFSDLKFRTPIVRAEILARQRLTNNYLTMYAGGGEIPPSKLMEYIEQAQMKIIEPESKEILEQYQSNLLRVLPVISEEIVMIDHQAEINSDSKKEPVECEHIGDVEA